MPLPPPQVAVPVWELPGSGGEAEGRRGAPAVYSSDHRPATVAVAGPRTVGPTDGSGGGWCHGGAAGMAVDDTAAWWRPAEAPTRASAAAAAQAGGGAVWSHRPRSDSNILLRFRICTRSSSYRAQRRWYSHASFMSSGLRSICASCFCSTPRSLSMRASLSLPALQATFQEPSSTERHSAIVSSSRPATNSSSGPFTGGCARADDQHVL
mmetsp:Transcript_127293/g.407453  ORF Transcript_127293/g.407453 Transcript_127293/m.407453 type:complete len:210 (+) Transcript_127293:1906-2535(+)